MPNPTVFPTLYKKSETGAIIRWDILVDSGGHLPAEGAVISTRWGQEGGSIQETRDLIKEGKNVGKKNETTPFEQAVSEAEAKWTKQQKAKKYVQTREAALSGERDVAFVAGGIDPMLAFPLDKKPKAIQFPCDDQPKLDGFRCLASRRNGKWSLYTRTRALYANTKGFVALPHIEAALTEHCKDWDVGDIDLDGELYDHDLAEDFEEMSHRVKSGDPRVKYNIYDVAFTDMPWKLRKQWLKDNFGYAALPLVLVESQRANSMAELVKHREAYEADLYEGSIVRNLDGRYENKRSVNLLKMKSFVDEEFTCIAVNGKKRTVTTSKGTKEVWDVNFVVQLPNGVTTEAPMMGKKTVVQKYFEDQSLVIGKKLTVRFQGWTEDGSLRFPKCRFFHGH